MSLDAGQLFILLNPELNIDPDEGAIDQIQDFLINRKRPNGSSKHNVMQTRKWLSKQKAFEARANFDPSERPNSDDISHTTFAV